VVRLAGAYSVTRLSWRAFKILRSFQFLLKFEDTCLLFRLEVGWGVAIKSLLHCKQRDNPGSGEMRL
jgi:hypothetical protein